MVNQKVAARLQVGPNCLLLFIDVTGHETFADKNYPVFGLGGCAISSSSAAAVIAEPWRAMKAAHFGGEDVPLHANELRNPTTEQLDALSKFFRERQFARFAVTMSKSAVLPAGKTSLEIITGSMMNRYTDLLRRVSPEPNELAFLHEASNRLDDAIEQHFGGAVAPRCVACAHRGRVLPTERNGLTPLPPTCRGRFRRPRMGMIRRGRNYPGATSG
jgi:hypothetical protein